MQPIAFMRTQEQDQRDETDELVMIWKDDECCYELVIFDDDE